MFAVAFVRSTEIGPCTPPPPPSVVYTDMRDFSFSLSLSISLSKWCISVCLCALRVCCARDMHSCARAHAKNSRAHSARKCRVDTQLLQQLARGLRSDMRTRACNKARLLHVLAQRVYYTHEHTHKSWESACMPIWHVWVIHVFVLYKCLYKRMCLCV